PFLASAAGAQAIARINAEADGQARAMPEVTSFQVEQARPILDQFTQALPRNLIIAVTTCTPDYTGRTKAFHLTESGPIGYRAPGKGDKPHLCVVPGRVSGERVERRARGLRAAVRGPASRSCGTRPRIS